MVENYTVQGAIIINFPLKTHSKLSLMKRNLPNFHNKEKYKRKAFYKKNRQNTLIE